MKKLLAFLLVLAMVFSLALPVAAEETPEEPAPATAQVITDAIYDCHSFGFLNDSYGLINQYTNYRAISVFGEPLTDWGGASRALTEDVFAMALPEIAIYALFHRSGRQLTGYMYSKFEVFEDYIRAKKGEVLYDFFTLDGRSLPKPVIPNGYVTGKYLGDGLVVAGDPTLRPNGYPGYSWALFTMDGKRITPEGKLYRGIERLTDDLLILSESKGGSGIINEQGEWVYPVGGSYSLYILDTGEFITSTMVDTEDPTLFSGNEYICYNVKGEQLWSYIGAGAEVLFGRYLAIETRDEKNVVLMDGSGPVEIPEETAGIGAEGFGIGNILMDALREKQIPTPMFFTYGTDKRCTFYDLEGNVVIPATTCKYLSIGCGHVMFVNEEGNTELYTAAGEKVATLPGDGYDGLSSGLIWHQRGNAYAIYNLQGEQVTEYTYAACRYSGAAIGLVNVQRNGKWFLVNAEGEEQNKQGFDQPIEFMGHFCGYQIAGNWGIIRYLEPGEGLFWDVKEGDWFCDEVYYCYENDILNGTGVGRFQPDGVTTRAMVVTVLYRLAGSPEVEGELPFTDVETGQWYSDAVLWASQNDIVNGVGNDRFAPTANITREQIATILYRYSKFTGIEMAEGADLTAFPDSGKVADFALEGMAWAVAEGLITGTVSGGTTTLSPQASATRAQLATIISRYQQMFQ